MPGKIFWNPILPVVTLASDTGVIGGGSLTTLASTSGIITPLAYDNTAGSGLWGDLELFATFQTAPGAGGTVDAYLLESLDGVNFADGGSGANPVTNQSHYIGSFPLRAVTTAQRVNLRGVPLPPTKFNLQLVNSSGGASFAKQSTGQTIKFLPYCEQYA